MNGIWQLLWFIVAVSLLVTVHEFGHYWVARRLGFKVLRFSVGFGKPLVRRVWGADRTEYVLAAIPLGGYVKMLDEREGAVAPEDLPRAFTRKPPWQRILVLFAGPAFNIVFAIVVLWAMLWSAGVTELKPLVGEVRIDSPAGRAGLAAGDRIVAIDGDHTEGQRAVVFGLLEAISGSDPARLTVEDDNGRSRELTLSVPDAAERRRLTEPAALFDGLGFSFWQPRVPTIIDPVSGGPAANAGLIKGDEIIAIDGQPVSDFRELAEIIAAAPGESVAITYRRAGIEDTVDLRVAMEHVDGQAVGRIQVAVGAPVSYPDSMYEHQALTPFAALGRASVEAWDMTVLQAQLFARMLMGQVSLKNLSGPLAIAEFAGDSASAGVASFASFLVLISLSLGFLNLLPIPILDGGQIVFQLVEWLKGKPLSEHAQVVGQQVGIALLVLLMGVALFNDFARQFG